MIINIPLEFDEHMIEQKIQADYDKKFEAIIFQKIDDYIRKKAGYGRSNHDWGMEKIIDAYFDRYFDNHRDELIDIIADKITERARKYKKVKEATNELDEKVL